MSDERRLMQPSAGKMWLKEDTAYEVLVKPEAGTDFVLIFEWYEVAPV